MLDVYHHQSLYQITENEISKMNSNDLIEKKDVHKT